MPFQNHGIVQLAAEVAHDPANTASLKQFQKNLHIYELSANEAETGFCLFMAQPALLLYTSEWFTRQTGLEVDTGHTLSLELWLHTLPASFHLEQAKQMQTYLGKLQPGKPHEAETYLVLDYTHTRLQLHMEDTIKVLPLPHAAKTQVYWCWQRSLPHTEPPFSYTINLVSDNKVLEKLYHCPPLFEHSLLKTLTPVERKVLVELLNTDNSRTIAQRLNMSAETVKSHRRHIIGKTGYESTDGLVAVLKRDLGLGQWK